MEQLKKVFKRLFVFALFLHSFAFAMPQNEKDLLLRIIQGAYKDKIYSVAISKSKEYLKKADKNDQYRNQIYKILFYSLYYTKNKDEFWKLTKEIEKENLPKEDKETFYKLGLNLFKDEPEKLEYFYKKLNDKLPEENKEIITKVLAVKYLKNKQWEKVLSLPKSKEINLYRVIALYKLKKYKDVIKETENLGNFPADVKDTVLYFRGLAFSKLGKEKKAVDTIEAITFKTPEMIKFLANYYLKHKKYIYAQRYLRILSLEDEYKDYAYYYLGVIEDLSKNYRKAINYYRKASVYKTKYGKKAKERLSILEKAVPIYSVRLILLSSKEKAQHFIREKGLKDCFVKKYKKYYGVYCGKYENLEDAKKAKESLKKKGFDTWIQKM